MAAPALSLTMDPANSTLLLSADRFGQIPLFYSRQQGVQVFSTSLQWVVALAEATPELDPAALFHYLYFHCIPAPITLYRNISRLDAAQSIRLNLQSGELVTHTHWRPDFVPSTALAVDLEEQLFHQLQQAVVDRYEPGAGSFLSGGLDSSSITGMMCRYTQGRDAYSIGFPVERYDESPYARCAADHFGARLTRHSIQPDELVAQLPLIIGALEQPFGNSSVVPTYFCAALAQRDGKKILLAGDGGDELFGGNERYRKQLLFEHYSRLPPPLQKGVRALLSMASKGPRLLAKANSYIEQASTPLPDRLQSYNLLKRVDLTQFLSQDYLAAYNSESCEQLQRHRYTEVEGDCLNRMLYLDWKFTLCDNDLVKVNSMCSLAGIEVRYPMLDDALVDLSTSIPSHLKVHRQELRYLFKRSMGTFLPETIIKKSKHGFGLPYGYWLQEDKALQQLTFDAISSLSGLDHFRPNLADKVMRLNAGEHAHYFGELAWILMALGVWMDRVQHSASAGEAPPMRGASLAIQASSPGGAQ
ncbi:asparagine synthetase B family protein [Aestuariirhabdus litorea]|nr:asparagine synthetase B family protein [Aestuariirhabdus litorea]